MRSKAGRCLCGAVRFSVGSVETHHHACHCGMCRRWAGGPLFAASVDGVAFEGTESLATYSSSEWAERGFCRTCGSNLFYRLKPADQYMMCVGAFDDASQFHLSNELFIDDKPAGYEFAGDLTRLTEDQVFAEHSGSEKGES